MKNLLIKISYLFLTLISLETFSLTPIEGQEINCDRWQKSFNSAHNSMVECRETYEEKDAKEF